MTVNGCRPAADGGFVCSASFETISKQDTDRLILRLYQLHVPQIFGYRGPEAVAQLAQNVPAPAPAPVPLRGPQAEPDEAARAAQSSAAAKGDAARA